MLSDIPKLQWREKLLEAAETGSVSGIQQLLQSVTTVTEETQDKCIKAVYLAISSGHSKVIQEILTNKIFKGKEKHKLVSEFPDLLYHTISVCDRYKQIVRIIIDVLAVPCTSMTEIIGLHNEDGFSALHLAAIDGDVASARKIFILGGNGNSPSLDGNTALTLSIAYNHPHFWEFILPFSDPNSCDNDCDTPLMFAAWRRQHKLVNSLIKKGADCNACSRLYTTALWNAVYRCSYHCVRSLLENGADMRVKCEGTYLFLDDECDSDEGDSDEGGGIKLIYPGMPRSLLWVCIDHCGRKQTRNSSLQILSLLLAAGYDPTQEHWIIDLKASDSPNTLMGISQTSNACPSNIMNDSELLTLLTHVHSQPLQLRDLCRNRIRLLYVDSKRCLSFKKWLSLLEVGSYTTSFLTAQYL